MAARADVLRDFDENAPAQWDEAFREGHCHIALTIYAVDKAALDKAVGKLPVDLPAPGAPDTVVYPFGHGLGY